MRDAGYQATVLKLNHIAPGYTTTGVTLESMGVTLDANLALLTITNSGSDDAYIAVSSAPTVDSYCIQAGTSDSFRVGIQDAKKLKITAAEGKTLALEIKQEGMDPA